MKVTTVLRGEIRVAAVELERLERKWRRTLVTLIVTAVLVAVALLWHRRSIDFPIEHTSIDGGSRYGFVGTDRRWSGRSTEVIENRPEWEKVVLAESFAMR